MPDLPASPAPRTLRCANAPLYAGFVFIVWVAAAYVIFFREASAAELACAAVASVASLLWGGYYVLLRYEVDATGISRRILGEGQRLEWRDLTRATLRETHTQETASSVLRLETGSSSMELGSDLLSLENVQELARELGAEKS